MKRIVILGGTGFFGRLIAEKLRAAGLEPITAARTGGDLRIDADNPEHLRSLLKARDLVIDAAGPFQNRTPALIQAARTIGFDVIDLSDSVKYTRMVYENEAPILSAGIRVLTSCSALSTVSALVLKASSVAEPRRLSAYLVPASRYAASPGTVKSMLSSLTGSPRRFRFPRPLGRRAGVTVESVDVVTLPRIFSSLRTTELVVDVHIPGANLLLLIAAHWPAMRRVMEQYEPTAIDVAHRIGPKQGALAYEIASTGMFKYVIFHGQKSHMIAVMPAVQAAIAMSTNRFAHRGLVPPTDHVDGVEFFEALKSEGIDVIAPRSATRAT